MPQRISSLPALTASGFDAYLETIGKFKILTPEQERELAMKYYEQEDVESARTLILSHLRFVVHIARSYNGYGLALPDLVQEGNVGLMKAIKRFNPHVGVRLVSFAVHWIKAEIQEYILKNWRIVKVATTKAQRKLFFNLRTMKKTTGWLSNKEVKLIADDLGVNQKDVREMEQRLTATEEAIDPLIEDTQNDYAPQQYLEDHSQDPASAFEKQQWHSSSFSKVATAIQQLDSRSRDIIQQRWLRQDEDKSTLHDLASQYSISAERVRQIEERALQKIRTFISA